ncbi:proline iminopeptidase-family hydrolase [Hymenobacter qilianensis]|uniref:Proline iminopeptidase-family hydrolase n=2 Tax=Hymenobacter qilianensis TaxID=1385715 RepID=A0A7H0GY70_9BACT|nr:proline iminopeptidase-family hydrolase [Hymenobacter qilianensis]QNP53236.1 proline iminopeptidase-family hydrolase [Hymenobacter qilianensis]
MKHFLLSRRTLLLATICWALGFAVQAQPTMKEGYITVPGGKVWYKVLGADKPGIPLLLLHGGPGSGSGSFEGFVALADERPVIMYDQLGCGKSDKPDNPQLWTLERFVTELEQIIAALGYPKLHLLGHSWGGTLATEYLLTKKPPTVVSLIQSSPLLDTKRWVQDAERYIAQLPPAQQKAMRLYAATDEPSKQAYKEAVTLYNRRHLYRNGPMPPNPTFGMQVYETMWGPDEAQATGTLKNYSRANDLKKLTVPVLYLCGRFDEAAPATVAYFQKQTPNSQLVVFENASHKAYWEVPEQYFQTVRAFLHKQK